MPACWTVSNEGARGYTALLRLFHHLFPIFEAWLHVTKHERKQAALCKQRL